MRFLFIYIFLLFFQPLYGQNPEGFQEIVDKKVKGTVPQVTVEDLTRLIKATPDILLLDCRQPEEYHISHLPNATFAGYRNFQLSSLQGIDKTDKIIVYCSIGVRSEKIGEQLIAAGYSDVHNLIGGLFEWVNTGNEVVNKKGKSTSKVHGFNKYWSTYLNKERCTIVL